MAEHACRACQGCAGDVVLDLGEQPACDYFPSCDDPGPDPLYPLQMWLCSSCGLAQLLADPTVPAEPKGAEPAALRAQAADAVRAVAAAGLLRAGDRVAEYGSPHGGTWLGLLADRGLLPAGAREQANIVLDCFGLMHAADQAAALARRVRRVAPGGLLMLQYHSAHAIVRDGQWNALRHGHYAYYSTTALTAMLASAGFRPRRAWDFSLYGGTVLMAASAKADPQVSGDGSVESLVDMEQQAGVQDPAVVAGLQRAMRSSAEAVRNWLVEQRSADRNVLGYGAASRAVALLRHAGADRSLLPAVVDASPAKQGLRMPGTDIPIVSPGELAARQPDAVLLLLADLMPELRTDFPGVEAAGGQWVDATALAQIAQG